MKYLYKTDIHDILFLWFDTDWQIPEIKYPL